MLFNFELTPVGDVIPWGTPDNKSLSWFGLTDGQYWIDIGDSALFEYSEHARRSGSQRYCDYQVIRLLEDILDMLPSILQPVPAALVPYLSGDSGKKWRGRFDAWSGERLGVIDDDEYWQLFHASNALLYGRFLDSAYLSPSASILIWSDKNDVHIEWDNSEKFLDGESAWAAMKGTFMLPRDNFLSEVEAFHSRLIEEMTLRVEQVVAGACSPSICIDLPGLISEHEQRRKAFRRALETGVSTSWDDVKSAIDTISGDISP